MDVSAICRLRFAISNLQSTVRTGTLILAAIAAISTASASELQWRHAKPGAKPAAAKAESRPAEPKVHRDEAVQTVAFEDEKPAEPLRSMVVPRGSNNSEQASEAQESPAGAEDLRWGQRNPAPDTRYEQQIRQPFGSSSNTTDTNQGMEGLTPPANETAPAQLPPTTEEELTLPEPNNNRHPGMERNPQGTQPDTKLRNPPVVPRPHSYNDPFDSEPLPKSSGGATGGPSTAQDVRGAMSVDCSGELAKLKARTLADVNLNIAVTGTEGEDFPVDCPIDTGEVFGGRCWSETNYMWKASALCHKPLYFEDEALERYGHSWGPCLDPIVSGAHFFCKLPVLPYCMGLTPPQECMYALGHYRPGDCAPYMIDPVPLSCRAAAFEAGAWTGGVLIIP